jgi:hypothetical protein
LLVNAIFQIHGKRYRFAGSRQFLHFHRPAEMALPDFLCCNRVVSEPVFQLYKDSFQRFIFPVEIAIDFGQRASFFMVTGFISERFFSSTPLSGIKTTWFCGGLRQRFPPDIEFGHTVFVSLHREYGP